MTGCVKSPRVRLAVSLIVLITVSLACWPGPGPGPAEGSTVGPVGEPTMDGPTAPVPSPDPGETDEEATVAPPAVTAGPAPTSEADRLAIVSFSVDVEDLAEGKRVTCTWQTSGAVRAIIWSGTSQRFPPSWEVEPNGTLAVELDHTTYRDPSIGLTAYDAAGESVAEWVDISWPCAHTYFFPTDLDLCPAHEPVTTRAAEQPFEGGRMIWLQQGSVDGPESRPTILALYDDGTGRQLDDTFVEGEQESDPSLVPPSGLLQPIRGFGKVWRENDDVRDRLGWATAEELGFEGVWQIPIHESLGGAGFVQRLDGKIIRIDGWGMGTCRWEVVHP